MTPTKTRSQASPSVAEEVVVVEVPDLAGAEVVEEEPRKLRSRSLRRASPRCWPSKARTSRLLPRRDRPLSTPTTAIELNCLTVLKVKTDTLRATDCQSVNKCLYELALQRLKASKSSMFYFYPFPLLFVQVVLRYVGDEIQTFFYLETILAICFPAFGAKCVKKLFKNSEFSLEQKTCFHFSS